MLTHQAHSSIGRDRDHIALYLGLSVHTSLGPSRSPFRQLHLEGIVQEEKETDKIQYFTRMFRCEVTKTDCYVRPSIRPFQQLVQAVRLSLFGVFIYLYNSYYPCAMPCFIYRVGS